MVTGALFALEPAQYLPVAGGFALLVGFAELLASQARGSPEGPHVTWDD
jgi:hypothetical protein